VLLAEAALILSQEPVEMMVKKEYDVGPLLLLRNATFFWGEKKCEHD